MSCLLSPAKDLGEPQVAAPPVRASVRTMSDLARSAVERAARATDRASGGAVLVSVGDREVWGRELAACWRVGVLVRARNDQIIPGLLCLSVPLRVFSRVG